MSDKFTVKDSGQRTSFDSGMVRDIDTNKTMFHLIADGPMLERWAIHLTKGAAKYSEGNWLKANGQAELDRFRKSAFRHFVQWFRGDVDEDHAAAVYFNINGAEYVKARLSNPEEKLRELVGEAVRSELSSSGSAKLPECSRCGNPHPHNYDGFCTICFAKLQTGNPTSCDASIA